MKLVVRWQNDDLVALAGDSWLTFAYKDCAYARLRGQDEIERFCATVARQTGEFDRFNWDNHHLEWRPGFEVAFRYYGAGCGFMPREVIADIAAWFSEPTVRWHEGALVTPEHRLALPAVSGLADCLAEAVQVTGRQPRNLETVWLWDLDGVKYRFTAGTAMVWLTRSQVAHLVRDMMNGTGHAAAPG